MGEYLSPGVYAESVNKSGAPIEAVSSSTGGFIGITARGVLKKPILVTSWQNFLDTFAYGLETPFLADSDLAYSVYGFFQNGGTRCYVIRVASASAKKASTGDNAIFTALDEGTWGNNISYTVKKNEDNASNFDISILYNGEEVEKFTNVSADSKADNFFVTVVNDNSKYVTANSTGTLSVAEGTKLTGGDDGITGVADTDYSNALQLFDSVDDVNLICVPGQVSDTMIKAVLSYAENRGNVFAIVDGAKSADVAAIKTLRKSISCKNGALYYPWIKVSDPLSKTGKLRDCPACGHIMGVYARTIQERGVWKAPAGIEANVRGAIDVVRLLSKGDCDILNPLGVNAILPKANYGIVVWGARSLNPDATLKYVSDVLLNINIKESIERGTQWAVFEPNNSLLWTRVKTSAESFLDTLWRDGGLFGDKASEAYFVKCDGELNTEDVRNNGRLICEIGYASNKPAEFVIFRISHSISSN